MDTWKEIAPKVELRKWILPVLLVFGFTAVAGAPRLSATPEPEIAHPSTTTNYESWLNHKVYERLVTMPWYDVFDNVEYKISGNKITLLGQVVFPVTRSSVADSVKGIKGVTQVVNEVKNLPFSPFDNQIRWAEYRALFSEGSPLFHYSLGVNPRIHIIVDNSRVTLVGVVDSQADREIAGLRAKTVPMVFSVKNELKVV
jgi:osmotically-inducible protein OsmY